MKTLLVVFSYHHHNTEKIAKVFARVLHAQIKTPQQIDPSSLRTYDLVGFGSGIDSDKHYRQLLDFADRLPSVVGKKAFIFSTCGNPFNVEKYAITCHSALRETLKSKGYEIVDEFICRGFDTNSYLKYFGGLHKRKPNDDDFRRAEDFAKKLNTKI